MPVTSQAIAVPRKRLWRHAIRAVTACILAYVFLYVLEIANGTDLPVQYTAVGRIFVSEAKVLSNDNAETAARKATIFQAQVQLKQLADNGAPAPTISALQAHIEEKEKWIKWAREIIGYLAPFDGMVDPGFGIWEWPKPDPFQHGMDPYSLVIHHPWRTLVSLSLAWLLAVLLLPLRRAVPPEAPVPQPTEA